MTVTFQTVPPVLTQAQFNAERQAFCDRLNAITSTGLGIAPYSFYVRKSGAVFEAYDATSSLVYGGASDVGGVDGSSAYAVIQASIDALTSGGVLYISKGDYNLSQSLTVDHPIIIEGEGSGNKAGVYTYGTRLITDNATAAITIDPGTNVEYGITLRSLHLYGNSTGTIGLHFLGQNARCSFYDLVISKFTNLGCYIESGFMHGFYSCRFVENGSGNATDGGLKLSSAVDAANSNHFYNCICDWNDGSGVVIQGGYGNAFFGCVFEANHLHGVYGYNVGQHVTIENCYFEYNNVDTAANVYDIYISTVNNSYWGIRDVKAVSTNVTHSIYNKGSWTTLDNIRGNGTQKIYWEAYRGLIVNVNPVEIDFATSTWGTEPGECPIVGSCFSNWGKSTGTGSEVEITHSVSAGTPTSVILWNIDSGANPYQSSAATSTKIKITAVGGKQFGWMAIYHPAD